ncbi:hypothetical protein V1504DRAFT_472730 [Lipomyces starkeyi]
MPFLLSHLDPGHATTLQGKAWMGQSTNKVGTADGQSDQLVRTSGWKANVVNGFARAGEQGYAAPGRCETGALPLLMHCTGGQPARGAEVIGIRYQNTRNGGVRNIFIEDGLVCFVTSYHKAYEASEKLKVIQRFLPREVGELLVYYLWLVRPFWECVEMMTSRITEFSPFVWGRPTDEEDEEPTKHPERGVDDGSPASDRESEDVRRRPKAWTSERSSGRRAGSRTPNFDPGQFSPTRC